MPAVRSEAEIVLEQELKYYFYQAMLRLDQNRYDEAMALLLHCEKIAPDDAAVNHYLGIMYGGLNQKERAFAYHERAYRLYPDEYWYAYCVQLFQTGEKTKKLTAIRELEKLAQRHLDDLQMQETLQQLYLNTGDLGKGYSDKALIKKAIRQQDRIDRIEGPSPYGSAQRYQLLAAIGQTHQARKAIEDYLREDPYNYYMQVFLGDIDLRAGRTPDAFRQYNAIRKTSPENPYLALSLSNYYGTLEQFDSAAHYQREAVDNEMIDLDYKLNILKDYPWLKKSENAEYEALQSLVRQYPQQENSLFALAQYCLDNERPSEAEPLLWTVIDINPKNDRAWQSLLGIAQADTTTSDSVYEHLVRQALVSRPEQKQWYYLMSIIQARKDDLDSCIWYCKEGLRQPDEIDLRNKLGLLVQLGDTYMRQNVPDSAYTYYDAALAYDPENVYILNNYAYFMAVNGGDLRKAEKMSARTIKKDPDSPTYLDTYAWILHLQGQDLLARFYMQQAWDKSTDHSNPELLEHYEVIFGKKPE